MNNLPLDQFPADAVEQRLETVDAARRELDQQAPDALIVINRFVSNLDLATGERDGLVAAMVLAQARMGARNGRWSGQFLHYHNERHSLEVLSRLRRLTAVGASISAHHQALLGLFATMHDLRQRETSPPPEPVGANETASIAESVRILEQAGLADAERWRTPLTWMIAGSTFAVPSPRHPTPGGALAGVLIAELTEEQDDLRNLMAWAADLDTANVADPIDRFAQTAVDLCTEREMRLGRAMNEPASTASVLAFLTAEQHRFFFDLHRFHSDAAHRAFGPAKQANEKPVQELVDRLRQTASGRTYQNGEEIAADFVRYAAQLLVRQG